VTDPITFNRDGDWTTATYRFVDGTTVTGTQGAGDQAALRGLVYRMAGDIRYEKGAVARAHSSRDMALNSLAKVEKALEEAFQLSTERLRAIEQLKADLLTSSLAATNYATQVGVLNNQLALTRIEADGYAEQVKQLSGYLEAAQDREVELAVELAAMDRHDEEVMSPKDRALQAALAADQAAEEAAWKESRRYMCLASMWTALAAISEDQPDAALLLDD
jgi:hypothetical protein